MACFLSVSKRDDVSLRSKTITEKEVVGCKILQWLDERFPYFNAKRKMVLATV